MASLAVTGPNHPSPGDLAARQFGGPFSTPAEALARSGWSRSVGGANPYLALQARGGFSREAVDAAITAGEIAEVDAARGCTYVVPAEDLDLAASLAAPQARKSTASDLKRLGYSAEELAKVEAAMLDALAKEPLDAAGLKAAVGNLNAHFGVMGKKVGRIDAVSLATSSLVGTGRIRRVAQDGRLDRQRYRYALAPEPAPTLDAHERLASKYWAWIGTASLRDFAGFAGLSLTEAKAAIAPLQLVATGEWLAAPLVVGHEDERVRLVGVLDNVAHLRWTGGPPIHPSLAGWQAPGERFPLSASDQMPLHLILRGATLIGLWHFDPDAHRIVSRCVENGADVRAAISEAEALIDKELGDARSFSLDSVKSRAAMFAWLQEP